MTYYYGSSNRHSIHYFDQFEDTGSDVDAESIPEVPMKAAGSYQRPFLNKYFVCGVIELAYNK